MTPMMSGSVLGSVIVAKIRYSAAAIQDLEEIGDYIADTLKSSIAALNTVNKIQDAVDKLGDFPFIGSLLSGVVKTETNYCFLVCGNYLLFYRAQTDSVYISRVLYGRRDYMAILFDDAAADEPEQTPIKTLSSSNRHMKVWRFLFKKSRRKPQCHITGQNCQTNRRARKS